MGATEQRQWTLHLFPSVERGGTGTYFFFVFPVLTTSPFPDHSLFPINATPTPDAPPQGATPPVRVNLRTRGSDAPIDVTAFDGTPAGAYASHRNRANAIARHFAR